MKTLLGKGQESGNFGSDQTGNGKEIWFESKDVTNHNLLEGCKKEVEAHHGDDDNSRNVENVGKEAEILDLALSTDGSLTSSVDWCGFESGSYVDESSCSPWWEFWT